MSRPFAFSSASSQSSSSSSSSDYQLEIAKNPEDIQQCQALRYDVFITEQKVPKDAEIDGKDKDAVHVVCWYEGQVVATGRVLLIDSPFGGSSTSSISTAPEDEEEEDEKPKETTTTTITEAVLGRIAVHPDHRGKGLGSRVVRELERIAQSRGASSASLTPHHYLERFYARLGYQRLSGENELIHINEYCQLIQMGKSWDIISST